MIRLLAILTVLFTCVLPVAAQVNVKLELGQANYLAGEPIHMRVTITNLTGQEVNFMGTPDQPWLDFIISSSRGVPLAPMVKPIYGATSIPPGKAISKSIEITQIFSFKELGNYSVYAIVRPSTGRKEGYQSNRHLFTVTSAAPYWTREIGVNGRTHIYKLTHFKANRKGTLYAQVIDKDTDRILTTHNLGEMLMVRKPTATIDSSRNLHVLYMMTPAFWGHARVSPEGHFIGRDLYRPAGTGVPRLGRTSDGAITVVGGLYFDREKEAAEQRKIPKASDRPDNFLE